MSNINRSAEGERAATSPSPGYPSLSRVLQKIVAEAEGVDRAVARLEVNILPSGEATYRVWEPGAEESDGGYFAKV